MLERRRAIPRAKALAAGEAVARRVAELPEFVSARSVAVYAALPDELPSRALFELARGSGKRTLLPRMRADQLEFAAVRSWEDLRPGRYGVLAPPPEAPSGEPDLVLVPGVAFDRCGRRLGRGGGHYDRALAAGRGRAPVLIGVAYEMQLVDEVPHGVRDRAVDVLVTEQAVRRCRESA
jgi:5-formyltetrahydrofolate cyclo-ligase